MDHRSLSRLLLRIAGVVVVVATLTSVPKSIVTLVVAAGQDADVSPLMTAVVASLVPLLIGLALIWLPGTVANWLVDDTVTDKSESDTAANLQAIALSVLGFYFVASALFDAVFWVARIRLYAAVIASNEAFAGMPPLMPDDFGSMVATGAQAVVGVLLLLGSKGAGRLLSKARGRT
ncbi:hypothetical protein [Acidovorax sp. ACV01]|uniref:hypothetical protein n=1 Tax=Acidovorax sp. ACV01 TaxID=2769311 RepID=UPI001781080E|nr:hypothetical protein [Acidovorax sp. ACV01]MBD9393270.1 hypothetical protein [Acidovorax sp. ACV01]